MRINNRRSPGAMRTCARSFLSAVLSVGFVIPGGSFLPGALAAADLLSADSGHGNAAPLHKDKKTRQDAALKGLPITELSADEATLHALNRLAYGPRPGDVERVRQMGLAKWIEQQLNPNGIEDRAVEARLEQLPTLRLSSSKLLAEYPQPKQQAKQAAAREARQEQRAQRPGDAAAETIAKEMSDKDGAATSGQAPENAEEKTQTADNTESAREDGNGARSMKEQSPTEMNAATRGVGKRDLLGGGDPNAVPRAIADDSKGHNELWKSWPWQR
jgi:hypothetical protein